MNLPNYFLADLPPEATLTVSMLSEAADTLKRNRLRYLAHRSTPSLISLLCGHREPVARAGLLVPASWRSNTDPQARGFRVPPSPTDLTHFSPS